MDDVDRSDGGQVEQWCEDAGWVRALARQLVSDASVADDLAQEAWLRTLRGPGPGPDRFRAWVTTVLRNLAHSHQRVEARRQRHESASLGAPVSADSPAGLAERLEAHTELVTAVRALDEPYRSAILLRYFEGLTPRAMSTRQGVPVRTVHTRLRRALEMLRARLRGRASDDRRWVTLLAPLVSPLARPAALTTVLLGPHAKVAVVAALCVSGALLLWMPPGGTSQTREGATAGANETEASLVDTPPAPTPNALARQRIETAAPPAADDEAQRAEPFLLRGRVLDLDARPIGAVAVVFTPFGGATHNAGKPTTDAAGDFEFEFEDVLGGTLDIDDPAWTTVYRPILWGQRGVGPLTIVAAPSVRVAGVVVDEAGHPLPGAEVQLSAVPPGRASFPRSLERDVTAEWKATTDADGHFELARAPRMPGAQLHTSCRRFRNDHRPLPADTSRVWIQLGASPTLTGVVVDSSGKSCAGAAVFLGAAGAQADGDGRFEIDLGRVSVDISPYKKHRWLIASKAGRLPARLRCEGEVWDDPRSWPRPLVLRLGGPALSISGRVLSAAGQPYPAAVVTVVDPEPLGDPAAGAPVDPMSTVEFLARVHVGIEENGASFWEASSGHAADGFSIGGLQDRPYRLRVEDKAALRWFVTESIRAGAANVELRFQREELWPRIAGILVDRRDRPVAGASVWFERAEDGMTRHTPPITTDAPGTFEREGLARAAASVLVQTTGLAQPTRFALADLDHLGALRLVVPVRASVRIERTAATAPATAIAFLDAAGQRIAATMTHGDTAMGQECTPLEDGSTGVFTVPDNAVEALLLQGATEIHRFPVDLASERVNILRP